MTTDGYRNALTAAHERIAALENRAPAPALTRPAAGRWIGLAAFAGVLGAACLLLVLVLQPRPVGVTGIASNSGWIVRFHLPSRSTEVAYRMPGDADFERLGTLHWSRDAESTQPTAQDFVTIPFDRLKEDTDIEIRYVDRWGIRRGPVKVTFSPRREAVSSVTSTLNVVGEWVAFRPASELGQAGGPYLYFTTLVSQKYALREIRYSVDSEAVDRTVHFEPSDRPGISASDELWLKLAEEPAFVAVQVVYLDGTRSAIRRFVPTSKGTGASWIARPSPSPALDPSHSKDTTSTE